MEQKTAIKLFEEKQVRSIWNETDEKWYFSIVDIVQILTNHPHHQGARNYWKVLKSRLVKEGNETVTNCNRLKLVAEDGKMRLTDVADTEQLFRENLRDNMTNLELVLNMLAEATTTEISKEKHPQSFEENRVIANQGGTIAGNTRKEIEEKTGKRVVSKLSAKKMFDAKQLKKSE